MENKNDNFVPSTSRVGDKVELNGRLYPPDMAALIGLSLLKHAFEDHDIGVFKLIKETRIASFDPQQAVADYYANTRQLILADQRHPAPESYEKPTLLSNVDQAILESTSECRRLDASFSSNTTVSNAGAKTET